MKNIFFMVFFSLCLYLIFFYILNINSLFIPDFYLIVVFFIGIYFSEGYLFCFFWGISRDIFEVGILGTNAFLFLLIVFLIRFLLKKIYFYNILNLIIVIFIFSNFYYILKYFIFNCFTYTPFNYFFIIKSIVIVIISPLIFRLNLKIFNINNVAK